MKYKKGYKYQLVEDDWVQTGIIPPHPIDIKFISLGIDGKLRLRNGYASDGPSGPTIDTKSSIKGAFFHDGLCQLVRMEKLRNNPLMRSQINETAHRIWVNSGMWKWRADNWLRALNTHGDFAMDPANAKRIYEVF